MTTNGWYSFDASISTGSRKGGQRRRDPSAHPRSGFGGLCGAVSPTVPGRRLL